MPLNEPMNFFDRFKKKRESGLPDKYKDLITPEDYVLVLETAKRYYTEQGVKVIRIGEGELVVKVNGKTQHCFLDNLVRMLAAYEKIHWQEEIYKHFNKLRDPRKAAKYLNNDFEYAAPMLRALIKGEKSQEDPQDAFVSRFDYPETTTFLVIEFEQQFIYVSRENSAKWNKTVDELFEIAISNTPVDEVEARLNTYCDKFPTYVFLGHNFSASLMLDLPSRLPAAFGTYGSMIVMPTKGTALAHPIERGDILELVETLTPMVVKCYNEDPGNITTNFYWRYGEHIEKFPTETSKEGTTIRLPGGLLTLLKD